MSRKSERLMNLHIMLLAQRRHVAKEDIRRALYPDYDRSTRGDDAFEKAFERDKEDLRDMGVVIDVASLDPFFDDEVGYRIRPDQSALPDLRFEADEAAVLGVAARAWEQATVAKATTEALRKLAAAGAEVDVAHLDLPTRVIRAEEPAFETFWEGAQRRRVVTFGYRRVGDPEPTGRRLETWGVVRSSGRWYAVGRDVDRGAERVFRLSRVEGDVKLVGRSGAYEVPAGTDVRAVAKRLVPASPPVTAALLVRQGAGWELRRRAVDLQGDVAGPDEHTGWDRVVVEAPRDSLADEVLSHGASVLVESPDELRDEVVGRLRAAVARQEGVSA